MFRRPKALAAGGERFGVFWEDDTVTTGLMYAFRFSADAANESAAYVCDFAGHEGHPRRATAFLAKMESEGNDVVAVAVTKACTECVPKFVAIHEER